MVAISTFGCSLYHIANEYHQFLKEREQAALVLNELATRLTPELQKTIDADHGWKSSEDDLITKDVLMDTTKNAINSVLGPPGRGGSKVHIFIPQANGKYITISSYASSIHANCTGLGEDSTRFFTSAHKGASIMQRDRVDYTSGFSRYVSGRHIEGKILKDANNEPRAFLTVQGLPSWNEHPRLQGLWMFLTQGP